MSGGVIFDNVARFGGGVYNGEDGFFVMSGGEITRNTALFAGGVQYYSGDVVMGSVTLSGGKIFDNVATNSYSGSDNDLGVVFVDGFLRGRSIFYMLFFILCTVVVAVVVVCVLLFYRSKRRKQLVAMGLAGSEVV
jgi:hypothetical protein